MTNSQRTKGAGFQDFVLYLFGESQLLLVDFHSLLDVVHLGQDVAHVGERPELGLAVLGHLSDC